MARGQGRDGGARIQGRYAIDGDAVAAAAAVLKTLARTGAPGKAMRELAEMVIPSRAATAKPAATPKPETSTRPSATPSGMQPLSLRRRAPEQPARNAEAPLNTKGVPVLPAFSTTDWDGKTRILKVWCRHCRKWHIHSGGTGPGAGDGHREAHCLDTRSPFRETGYVLREIAELSD